MQPSLSIPTPHAQTNLQQRQRGHRAQPEVQRVGAACVQHLASPQALAGRHLSVKQVNQLHRVCRAKEGSRRRHVIEVIRQRQAAAVFGLNEKRWWYNVFCISQGIASVHRTSTNIRSGWKSDVAWVSLSVASRHTNLGHSQRGSPASCTCNARPQVQQEPTRYSPSLPAAPAPT